MKTNSSAPKGKEMSEKSGIGAKGGTTKMFGPQSADPAKPGTASPSNGRHSPNNKFGIPSNAGKGRMAGPQGAKPAVPGKTSVSSPGPEKWGVKGGTTKMFGKQSASPAQAGTTSVRNG